MRRISGSSQTTFMKECRLRLKPRHMPREQNSKDFMDFVESPDFSLKKATSELKTRVEVFTTQFPMPGVYRMKSSSFESSKNSATHTGARVQHCYWYPRPGWCITHGSSSFLSERSRKLVPLKWTCSYNVLVIAYCNSIIKSTLMYHVEIIHPVNSRVFMLTYIETIVRLVHRQYVQVHICCFIFRIVFSPFFCVLVNQKDILEVIFCDFSLFIQGPDNKIVCILYKDWIYLWMEPKCSFFFIPHPLNETYRCDDFVQFVFPFS